MGVLKRISGIVDGFLRTGCSYPPQWFVHDRLRAWELWHVDPRSEVWALYDLDGQMQLFAPGSPNPRLWPNGACPYELARPVAVRPQLDTLMPYPQPLLDALISWVQEVTGGTVLNHEQGLRWIGKSTDEGEPVMYLHVKPEPPR